MKKETVTFTYDRCSECPWCESIIGAAIYAQTYHICAYQDIGHKIKDIKSIPSWCQLENAE
jgi:hypothetical protein